MEQNTPPAKTSPAADLSAPIVADDLLDCVWQLDMKLRITYASGALEAMLGIPTAAFLGSPLADHTTAAQLAELREVLAGLLAGTDRTVGLLHTIELRHASGQMVPCELHGRLVLDQNGQPVELIGVLRDISRRRVVEEAARQAERRRFELQKMEAIAQLAGGVVDDFEALLEALDAPHRETEEHGALAPLREQAAKRITQLRTIAGRLDLELSEVEIDALVTDQIAALRPELPGNVTILPRLRSGGSTVWADRRQLQKLLRNLCLNARDAMPQGGVITLTTGLRAAEPAAGGPPTAAPRPWVLVEVRDTGQGLDASLRERILEPFFTTKTGGSGLSLPLAHGIIIQHGGRLEVESQPGKGSAFCILLPARYAGETSAAGDEEGAARPHVLLVDDDPEVLRYCNKILGSGGFEVVSCNDGAEALACIAGDDPVDLVVLDWALPGLDGRRVREQLARRHPHLPLLIISGHQREDFESLGSIDQDTPWLIKPFTPAALLAAVRAVLPARPAGS